MQCITGIDDKAVGVRKLIDEMQSRTGTHDGYGGGQGITELRTDPRHRYTFYSGDRQACGGVQRMGIPYPVFFEKLFVIAGGGHRT